MGKLAGGACGSRGAMAVGAALQGLPPEWAHLEDGVQSIAADAPISLSEAPPSLPPDWTVEHTRLERDLLAATADQEHFPTVEWFINAGHGDLLLAADRLGGRRFWQRHLGLKVRSHGGMSVVPYWTEERAEQALTHFLTGRDEWPTDKEFRDAQLANVLHDFRGGRPTDELARHYGLSSHAQMRWSADRIRRELGEFIGDRTDWPTQREFRETGRKGLLDAIYNHGGAAYWANEFGMTPRPHGRDGGRTAAQRAEAMEKYRASLWTDERIHRELVEFLGDRDTWPGRTAFEVAGRHTLYRAVKRNGGVRRWAPMLGLAFNGVKAPWTDDRVHDELTSFLGDRTDWPTNREFYDGGCGNLLQALYKRGGPKNWASQFGMTPRPNPRNSRN